MNRFARLFCTAVVTILCVAGSGISRAAAPAWSDDDNDPRYAPIVKAIDAKDYGSIWPHLKPLIDANDARGLFIAGVCHYQGFGVPRDFAQSIKFHQRAAEAGYPRAYAALGEMYAAGEGVPKDLNRARAIYEEGAMKGSASAALLAGVMHVNGDGVAQNYAEGYAWYMLSGNEKARANMQELEQKVLKGADLERAQARGQELRAQFDRLNSASVPVGGVTVGGVPIVLAMQNGKIVVAEVKSENLKESLQVGDELVEVDGTKIAGKSLEEATKLLTGQKDTMIDLRFDRKGTNIQIMRPRE